MLNNHNGNILMQNKNIYFVRSFHFDHLLRNDSLYNLQTCYKINVIFYHVLFMANLSLK